MAELAKIIQAGGGSGGGGIPGIGVMPARTTESSYTKNMGKGLREPCSPYRQAYVFGADLNVPNASNWNCVPEVVEPTTIFDLSSITPNHEVVVALSSFYGIEAGYSPWIAHSWYRSRDSKKLYTYSFQIPNPAAYGYDYWDWYYVYSYIGYTSWEIWENGQYYDKIFWENSVLTQINFSVSGIPEEEAEFQTLRATYARV